MDNTSVMIYVKFQTVVEDLGIYCSGKCWVLVTSTRYRYTYKGQVRGNDF
ncbi:MAG: hypothetical protein ACLTA8_08980 [Intestinibacter bartlettii]